MNEIIERIRGIDEESEKENTRIVDENVEDNNFSKVNHPSKEEVEKEDKFVLEEPNYMSQTFQGEMEPVLCILGFHDCFLYGGMEGDIRLISHDRGSLISLFRGHSDRVTQLVRFPEFVDGVSSVGGARNGDGEECDDDLSVPFSSIHFVSCSKDHDIRVWSLKQEFCLFCLSGHLGGVCDVCICSEHPKFVASCGDEGLVLLWNLETRSIVKSYSGHLAKVTCVGFVGADRLVSCSWDGFIKVVNFVNDDLTMIVNTTDNVPISCFSRLGPYFFLGCTNGDLVLFDSSVDVQNLETFDHFERLEGGNIQCLSIYGPYLFVGGENGLIYEFDISTLLEKVKAHLGRRGKGRKRRRKKKKKKTTTTTAKDPKGKNKKKEEGQKKEEEKEEEEKLLELIHVYEGHEASVSCFDLYEQEEQEEEKNNQFRNGLYEEEEEENTSSKEEQERNNNNNKKSSARRKRNNNNKNDPLLFDPKKRMILISGGHDRTVREWDITSVHERRLRERELEKEMMRNRIMEQENNKSLKKKKGKKKKKTKSKKKGRKKKKR